MHARQDLNPRHPDSKASLYYIRLIEEIVKGNSLIADSGIIPPVDILQTGLKESEKS
jgi:hypothetical protein